MRPTKQPTKKKPKSFWRRWFFSKPDLFKNKMKTLRAKTEWLRAYRRERLIFLAFMLLGAGAAVALAFYVWPLQFTAFMQLLLPTIGSLVTPYLAWFAVGLAGVVAGLVLLACLVGIQHALTAHSYRLKMRAWKRNPYNGDTLTQPITDPRYGNRANGLMTWGQFVDCFRFWSLRLSVKEQMETIAQ